MFIGYHIGRKNPKHRHDWEIWQRVGRRDYKNKVPTMGGYRFDEYTTLYYERKCKSCGETEHSTHDVEE